MSVRKNHRRPSHPIMQKIDDAIDFHEAHKISVDVDAITSNAAGRISGKAMLIYFDQLLSDWVRRRLGARGYLVSDELTFERKLAVEMTSSEFGNQVLVKEANERAIKARLKADHAVQKFLGAERLRLGREVTIGEFLPQVEKIYARFGF